MRKEACISVCHEDEVKAWNWKKLENKRKCMSGKFCAFEARHQSIKYGWNIPRGRRRPFPD